MATTLKPGARGGFAASVRRECGFLWRNPWELALVSWVPWLLLALIMAVFGSSVLRNIPIAVVDEDGDGSSRSLIRALDAAPGVYVRSQPATLQQAWHQVRTLEVYAVVYIPRDASRDMARGQSGRIFAFYNASYLTIGQAAFREIAAVVQARGAGLAMDSARYLRAGAGPSAVPVRVQSTLLFNPERSYEQFLGGLLLPAMLQLAACLALVAAFGRELRDATASDWLQVAGGRLSLAIAGKATPYLVLFTLYGVAAIVWVSCVRGDGIAGSLTVLAAGSFMACMAYGAIGLLVIGLTRNMGTGLSLAGIYAGVSVAFSGGTFPVIEGPLFSQIWSRLLPFTAYVKLQMQQVHMGSPWQVSMRQLGVLLAFVVIAGLPGAWAYGRAARDPAAWGRR